MLHKKPNTLRKVREYFHFSQKQIVAALKTSTSNYSRFETQEFLPENEDLINKLSKFYGCTVGFIKNFEEEKTTHINVHTASNSAVANAKENNTINNAEELKGLLSVLNTTVAASNKLIEMLSRK